MTDHAPLDQEQFERAMAEIQDSLVSYFPRHLDFLYQEWERLTGHAPMYAARLNLATLMLWFGPWQIERAMRIVAYRVGFCPPGREYDGNQMPISTWAIRQLLEEWRQDGRFGLEG